MTIRNKKQLSTSNEKRNVLEIIESGIKRVLPSSIIKQSVDYDSENNKLIIQGKTYSLTGKLFVIGGGKASGKMAEEIEKIIPEQKITLGIVNSIGTNYKTKKIKIVSANHPIPDIVGVKGTYEMLALKKKYSITKDDLILCLISGGGSALMPSPVKEITLKDKQKITNLLLECGAEINEINIVRKHLSLVKGGQLGKYFFPAKVVGLILSDVIGNPIDIIASGPTSSDKSTFQDAVGIIKKYDLEKKSPISIIKYLDKGRLDKRLETPKILKNCDNYIIGDNNLSLNAMFEKAKTYNYKSLIITLELKGSPEIAAKEITEEIIKNKYSEFNILLLGGETTPKLPLKHGIGGRNQHFVLSVLKFMKNYSKKWVVASCGTDGIDYISEAAGAIVGYDNLFEEKKLNESLKNYDSFNFLVKQNSIIKTDPTGTNVGDIIVFLI